MPIYIMLTKQVNASPEQTELIPFDQIANHLWKYWENTAEDIIKLITTRSFLYKWLSEVITIDDGLQKGFLTGINGTTTTVSAVVQNGVQHVQSASGHDPSKCL